MWITCYVNLIFNKNKDEGYKFAQYGTAVIPTGMSHSCTFTINKNS